MSGIKQTSELLRAVSAVLVEYLDAVKDGKLGVMDKLKLVTLYPTISQGIKGSAEIGAELKDLDHAEEKILLQEIKEMLLRTGKFTHRETDIAERVLALAYHNIMQISEMLSLPPTAELVE